MNAKRLLAAVLLVVKHGLGRAGSGPGPADLAHPLARAHLLERASSRAERFGPARWMRDGETYTTLEPSAGRQGARATSSSTARPTGSRRVLVPAAKLVPEGATAPLVDRRLRLVARRPGAHRLHELRSASGARTRAATTGRIDMRTSRLRQLGAGVRTIHADVREALARRPAGRLRDEEQPLRRGPRSPARSRRLTSDGNDEIVNGTSDWVYEEEFDLRDGFRWSPDSRSIAFWRFDTRGVPVFSMINNTDALYPAVTQFKYPKAGETNSAVQVGVVDAWRAAQHGLDEDGRATRARSTSRAWSGPATPREVDLPAAEPAAEHEPGGRRQRRPPATCRRSSPTRTRPGWR